MQRFSAKLDDIVMRMEKDDDGFYVLHKDATNAMSEKDDEIARLKSSIDVDAESGKPCVMVESDFLRKELARLTVLESALNDMGHACLAADVRAMRLRIAGKVPEVER